MEFIIQKAELHQAPAIALVIREAYLALEHKEWYVADDTSYIENLLGQNKGLGYVARETDSGSIAGIFLAAFPGTDPKNLGYDLGFSKEKLSLAAHMDSAAVLPQYRGHHLQYRLMQEAEKELRKMGYRYLLCTVHPDNHFSKNTILRQGYQVIATKEKYGGHLRDILLKEL